MPAGGRESIRIAKWKGHHVTYMIDVSVIAIPITRRISRASELRDSNANMVKKTIDSADVV
eukprot:763153-Hanusia_phi.AAC.2